MGEDGSLIAPDRLLKHPAMPKEDASQLILEPDEAMRELLQFAGVTLPEDADISFVRTMDVRISKRLITALALEALATIRFLARRGHFNAAKFLVDRCLGQAEAPFSEQTQRLSDEEATERLYLLYRKKGYTEAIARRMASRGGEFNPNTAETPSVPDKST